MHYIVMKYQTLNILAPRCIHSQTFYNLTCAELIKRCQPTSYLLRSLIMRFWNSEEIPLLKLGLDSSRSVCLSCILSVWWLGCRCR